MNDADDGIREVYKDAFAPPHPSRITKAWERAPVPAHAPRLQGQKIWKRAGVKSQREQDKENCNAAQKELDMEGKGSRKRIRRGAKENIGDATWKEDGKSRTNEDILDSCVTGSTNIESGTSVPLNDSDVNALQFVPRKRTNANHIIMPRKPQPLRQSTLNALAQTQAFTESQLSLEKPLRRRKSMRKSIRKSVAASIPDIAALPVETKSTADESVTEAPATLVEEMTTKIEPITEVTQPELAQADVEEPAVGPTLNDRLNKLLDLTDNGQPINENPEQTLEDAAAQSSISSPLSNQVVKISPNDVEEASEDISRPAQEEEKELVGIDKERSSRGRQPLQVQPAIFESIETDASAVTSIRPSKTTTTPKKKRGTSQRRGTRRSTRTTRASSVRADEQAAPEVNGDRSTPKESTNHPLEIAPEAPKEPKDVEPMVKSEPVIDGKLVAESELIPESKPVAELEPTMESEIIESVDVEAPEGSIEPVNEEFDSFDISAKPILENPATNPEQTTVDEDFELLPPFVSSETASLNTSHDEAKSEQVSRLETSLPSPSDESSEDDSSPVRFSLPDDESNPELPSNSEEITVEVLETLAPISISADSEDLVNENDSMSLPIEDFPETSTPDPTTSELIEVISENALSTTYDHDDTDMLRNFLTRVKANKAAKAGTHIPKRKRSLPHSPLRLPLGEADATISPSPPKMKDEFDVGLPGPSPSKRRKRNNHVIVDEDDTITEGKPTRRSGRTRLPAVKTPLGAPSHIPVRRLGQDGDTTVTLKRNEEKELAALTRVNTRKNKGGSQSVPEVLAKKGQEKEDPVLRQRLLKEVFDDKAQKGKKEKKAKTVIWAEELTQYQTVEGRKLDGNKEKEKESQKVAPAEEKKSAVKVGIRSKIALGMAANGTPAPKRKRTRS